MRNRWSASLVFLPGAAGILFLPGHASGMGRDKNASFPEEAGTVVTGSVLATDAMTAADTNQVDAKGRKQGLWVHKAEEGGLDYRGTFKDGMPQGWFSYTRHDTLVAKAFYFRGGYASHNFFYYPDGSLLSEGYYLDKQRDSVWKFYAPDGRLVKTESYEQGLKHGVSEYYDTAGLLMHQEWFRGLRNGFWFEQVENGFQEYTYKLNLSHGRYAAFFKDSVLAVEGWYEEGKKQGKWSFFLPSGTLYKEDFYVDHRLEKRVLYLKLDGVLRPVSMDTIALVMNHPQGGRAELLTDSGHRWVCDEKFETVCDILDFDFYFLANKNYLVAFRVLDRERLPEVLAKVEAGGSGKDEEVYDGQKDPLQQLGTAALGVAVELPLRVKPPFPVYLDGNGFDVLKNLLAPADMPAEEPSVP